MHGKTILKLIQKIFSWLPLATVIENKVLIVHGGISDTTDLDVIARVDRHKVREAFCVDKVGVLAFYRLQIQKHQPYQVCFIFVFMIDAQYVSVLRPPKATHHAANGGKTQTMSSRNGEAGGPGGGRRRVCSMEATAHRHELPRRSLNDAPWSSQRNWSVEEELKRRRRLAGFDQSYGELKKSDSNPHFGEITDVETDVDEWKQVSRQKGCRTSSTCRNAS